MAYCPGSQQATAMEPLDGADSKVPLRLVEFHVVHHCNLTCAGCSHFSPSARKFFVSRVDLANDVCAAAEHLNPQYVHVLGGEPLLHPELPELLALFGHTFAKSTVKLVTNGVMLLRRAATLMPVLHEHRIVLAVSVYPASRLDLEKIRQSCASCNVELELWQQDTFLDFIDPAGSSDPKEARLQCPMEGACNVRGGRLFPCPVTAWADLGGLPFSAEDGVLLQEQTLALASVPDRSRTTSLCRFCRVRPVRSPHVMTRRSRRRTLT